MKKGYEIVVGFLHSGRDRFDVTAMFQESSEPFDEKPNDEEVEMFVLNYIKDNTHHQ